MIPAEWAIFLIVLGFCSGVAIGMFVMWVRGAGTRTKLRDARIVLVKWAARTQDHPLGTLEAQNMIVDFHWALGKRRALSGAGKERK